MAQNFKLFLSKLKKTTFYGLRQSQMNKLSCVGNYKKGEALIHRMIFLLAIAGYISPEYGRDPYLTQEVPIKGLGIHLEMGDDDPVAQESFEDLEAEQRDNGNGYLIAAVPTPGKKKYNIFDVRGFNEWLFGSELYGPKLLHNSDPVNTPIKTVDYYRLSDARDAFEYVGNLDDLTKKGKSKLKEMLDEWYKKDNARLTFTNKLEHPVIILIPAKKAFRTPVADVILQPGESQSVTIDRAESDEKAYVGILKNSMQQSIAIKVLGSIRSDWLRRRLHKLGVPLAKTIKLMVDQKEYVIE